MAARHPNEAIQSLFGDLIVTKEALWLELIVFMKPVFRQPGAVYTTGCYGCNCRLTGENS